MNPYERQAQGIEHDDTSWRLATAGGDNKVRVRSSHACAPSDGADLARHALARHAARFDLDGQGARYDGGERAATSGLPRDAGQA